MRNHSFAQLSHPAWVGVQVIMSEPTWLELHSVLSQAEFPIAESLGVFDFSNTHPELRDIEPFMVYQLHPAMDRCVGDLQA